MNVKTPGLRQFWFEFVPVKSSFRNWVGVTAIDLEDAKIIVSQRLFDGGELPELRKVIEDVEFSDLDQGHVVPNMGVPIYRGIWYPRSDYLQD